MILIDRAFFPSEQIEYNQKEKIINFYLKILQKMYYNGYKMLKKDTK